MAFVSPLYGYGPRSHFFGPPNDAAPRGVPKKPRVQVFLRDDGLSRPIPIQMRCPTSGGTASRPGPHQKKRGN